MGQIDEMPVLA